MMDNIRYWSEKGITFQTFRYDYGINRLSSKSADKYIDSLKRQIFNRDLWIDQMKGYKWKTQISKTYLHPRLKKTK